MTPLQTIKEAMDRIYIAHADFSKFEKIASESASYRSNFFSLSKENEHEYKMGFWHGSERHQAMAANEITKLTKVIRDLSEALEEYTPYYDGESARAALEQAGKDLE